MSAKEEVVYLQASGGGRVRPHKLPLPEAIEGQLTKGEIRRVAEDGEVWTESAPAPERDPDAVPDGTVADVLEWVGEDKGRAERAIQAEWSKGDGQRKGIVDPLAKLLGLEQ